MSPSGRQNSISFVNGPIGLQKNMTVKNYETQQSNMLMHSITPENPRDDEEDLDSDSSEE